MKVKISFESGEPVITLENAGQTWTLSQEEADMIAKAARIVQEVARFNDAME